MMIMNNISPKCSYIRDIGNLNRNLCFLVEHGLFYRCRRAYTSSANSERRASTKEKNANKPRKSAIKKPLYSRESLTEMRRAISLGLKRGESDSLLNIPSSNQIGHLQGKESNSSKIKSKSKPTSCDKNTREKSYHLNGGIISSSQNPEYLNAKCDDIAKLKHGLDKVLFNPGVHYLQCPRTKHFNFDSYLKDVPPVDNFDFGLVPKFTPPSKDCSLHEKAKGSGAKFAGSTSSVSGVLSQIYFSMSGDKELSLESLPIDKQKLNSKFTQFTRLPCSIILSKTSDNQTDRYYAIDQCKFIMDDETILMKQGVVLENFLTLSKPEFQEYLLGENKEPRPVEIQDQKPGAFTYCNYQDLFLRSQIDCMNDKLPKKTFDLKTRATAAIRLNSRNHLDFVKYRLFKNDGWWNSFSREFYDLTRSAMIKYNFQVRIGNMDGIFIAYHNTEELFGFQYLPAEEMDKILYGSGAVGTKVFNLCLGLLNLCLKNAVQEMPNVNNIRLTFSGGLDVLNVYAEKLNKNFVQTGISTDELNSLSSDSVKRWTYSLKRCLNGEEGIKLDNIQESDDLELKYSVKAHRDCSLQPYRETLGSVLKKLEKLSARDKSSFMLKLFKPYFSNDGQV